MSQDDTRLSPGEKNSLLAFAKGLAGKVVNPLQPFPAARKAAAFHDLPAYQKMLMQRKAADQFGVSNPFFRAHDGRAGATTTIDGRVCVNFASYDYLGLNAHPSVGGSAEAAIRHYGTSVSASRVVAGERPLHRALENKLAQVYGTEDAAVFVSGHATNLNTIASLAGNGDLLIYDALIHNSVLVGAELSGAARRSFPHNDLDALEKILHENRNHFQNALIVVEGLYSMDGDFPDLPRLAELKDRFGAWLMVDEAHALGVLGKTGRGIAEHFGLERSRVDVWMGTLSKTLAACGGYVAGSRALVELLKFSAPGFVYSVGISPPLAAAALAAIEIMEQEPGRVQRLAANGRHFLDRAGQAGLDTRPSSGYAVVPVMIGDSLRAVKLSERLLARGFNILPIIYPAVPMQAARLRFFLTSEHSFEQIDGAIAATREELDRLEAENFGLSRLAARLAE